MLILPKIYQISPVQQQRNASNLNCRLLQEEPAKASDADRSQAPNSDDYILSLSCLHSHRPETSYKTKPRSCKEWSATVFNGKGRKRTRSTMIFSRTTPSLNYVCRSHEEMQLAPKLINIKGCENPKSFSPAAKLVGFLPKTHFYSFFRVIYYFPLKCVSNFRAANSCTVLWLADRQNESYCASSTCHPQCKLLFLNHSLWLNSIDLS